MTENEEMSLFMNRLAEEGITDSNDPAFFKLFGEMIVTPELDKQLISKLREYDESQKNTK